MLAVLTIHIFSRKVADRSVSIRVRLIMNHGTILEQNYRGAAREMVIIVFVRDCLIMNHGTIVQQNSRGRHVMSFAVSVRICLIMNHGTIFHNL